MAGFHFCYSYTVAEVVVFPAAEVVAHASYLPAYLLSCAAEIRDDGCDLPDFACVVGMNYLDYLDNTGRPLPATAKG